MAGRGSIKYESEHSLGLDLTLDQAEWLMRILSNACARAAVTQLEWRDLVRSDVSGYAKSMAQYYSHMEAAYRKLAYNVIEHIRHTEDRSAWHYQI
jgi:hypothetical protein